ncbi:MAG: GNAT family N-acetyltransferase [Nocardioidaceae bacterium]|nr:GNAT family N-acetyltransferase [Nocardioidaceae bacterium]
MTSADPLAHSAERTPLHDANGDLLLVFTAATGTRNSRPWADGVWRPADIPVADAAEAALAAFAGWELSTADRELAAALLAAGSLRLRHTHLMTHDLSTLPTVPPTKLAIEPLEADAVLRNADRLGEIAFAAYPAGHPDHSHDVAAQAIGEIAAIGRGELLGPVLAQSQLACHRGVIVGACLVVDREGQAPEGGPWVIELFRDPASPLRGVGEAMMLATLTAARETGLRSVSLVVSDENTPAIRIYTRLGFVEAEQSWTLALPAAP